LDRRRRGPYRAAAVRERMVDGFPGTAADGGDRGRVRGRDAVVPSPGEAQRFAALAFSLLWRTSFFLFFCKRLRLARLRLVDLPMAQVFLCKCFKCLIGGEHIAELLDHVLQRRAVLLV